MVGYFTGLILQTSQLLRSIKTDKGKYIYFEQKILHIAIISCDLS